MKIRRIMVICGNEIWIWSHFLWNASHKTMDYNNNNSDRRKKCTAIIFPMTQKACQFKSKSTTVIFPTDRIIFHSAKWVKWINRKTRPYKQINMRTVNTANLSTRLKLIKIGCFFIFVFLLFCFDRSYHNDKHTLSQYQQHTSHLISRQTKEHCHNFVW